MEGILLKHNLPWVGRVYRQRDEARRQLSLNEGTTRLAETQRDETRRQLSVLERTSRVAETQRDEARRQLSVFERTTTVAETKHHNNSFGQRTIIGSREDDLRNFLISRWMRSEWKRRHKVAQGHSFSPLPRSASAASNSCAEPRIAARR
jgi:hypothetical protein